MLLGKKKKKNLKVEKWIKGWGELNNINIKMSYSDAGAESQICL